MTPSNGGSRKRLVSQASVLSQPDLLSPEELFSQYTINDIQRNHKKIQRDIESKKSELRTMVGERYRELIDTADTIAAMEDTVRNIQSTLDSIQNSCKLERSTSKHLEEEEFKKQEFWSIASQMKLLVDTPQKIWGAMENQNYLIAGQLYLLSRHIVTNLHIGSGSASQLLAKFPVLPQQWGAISHFKPSILQGCRETLGSITLSDDSFAECVCTIILLEGVHLGELLQEILDRRLAAIARHLTSGGSVRTQLADCVESMICTLELLNNNLVSNNVIAEKLKHLCNNVTTMEVVCAAFQQEAGLQSITRHLPKLVHSYHPTLDSSLEVPDMIWLCSDWCDRVTQTIHTTFPTTLHYVNSVASVANLAKPYRQKSSNQWDAVCQSTMNKTVNIWQDMLMVPMNHHVKSIISTYIKDAMLSTNTDITNVVHHLKEVDVSDFVWNLNIKKEEKLQQKAEGFLDAVQLLCSDLNERLSAIYNDIITYTGVPEKSRYQDSGKADDIFAHIHDVTEQNLVHIAAHISSLLPDNVNLSAPGTADKLSLLAQICRCLVQHTPRLQQLLTPRDKYSRSSAQLYQCVETVKCGLLARLGTWISDVLAAHLASLMDAVPLTFAMVWEETTIQEEAEGGGSVESRISLPIYASSYINTLLYTLCNELYRMGCHGLQQNEIALMLGDMNEKVVVVYERWLEKAEISQNMALQYWLDFKYLSAMCNVSPTHNAQPNKKITTVVRKIENLIDPFDWDVFQPHLTANLHCLIRSTYNMYGALSVHSTTVQAIATTARSTPQQTTHNMLGVNEMVGRFPLLPVRVEPGLADEEEEEDLVVLGSLCRTIKQFTSPAWTL